MKLIQYEIIVLTVYWADRDPSLDERGVNEVLVAPEAYTRSSHYAARMAEL